METHDMGGHRSIEVLGAPKPGYVRVTARSPHSSGQPADSRGVCAVAHWRLASNPDCRGSSSLRSVDFEKSGAPHTTGDAHSDDRTFSAAPPALQ